MLAPLSSHDHREGIRLSSKVLVPKTEEKDQVKLWTTAERGSSHRTSDLNDNGEVKFSERMVGMLLNSDRNTYLGNRRMRKDQIEENVRTLRNE